MIVRPWLTYDRSELVPLAAPVEYRIDLIGTSNVFRTGHRLRLDVLGVSNSQADSARTGGIGAVQILRFRRKAVDHLRREHPGAIETMKAGQPFAHPGFADREGV